MAGAMYDIEAVKAIFVRAADIERRMVRVGPATAKVRWEEVKPDRSEWDEAAHADERAIAHLRRSITREEVAIRDQADELIDSLRRYPRDHALILAWFRSMVHRPTFAMWCRENGWIRTSALRRLNQTIFRKLADHSNRTGRRRAA
jgi:hypothetical protein